MAAAAGMSSGARLRRDVYVRSLSLTANEEIAKAPRRQRRAGAAAGRFFTPKVASAPERPHY